MEIWAQKVGILIALIISALIIIQFRFKRGD